MSLDRLLMGLAVIRRTADQKSSLRFLQTLILSPKIYGVYRRKEGSGVSGGVVGVENRRGYRVR